MNRLTALVGIDEASKHFGVSKRKLYALVEDREIPHYRIGKRGVRLDLDELRRYFAVNGGGEK